MKKRSLRLVSAVCLAGCGLLALGPLSVAFGQTGVCRTDPTMSLSNGVSVQMYDSISTDISNVSSVSYVLHVPKGVSVTGISYDSTGYLEQVQIVADQTGSHYSMVTTVYASVSAKLSASAVRRDGTTATKNGNTNSATTVNWCT